MIEDMLKMLLLAIAVLWMASALFVTLTLWWEGRHDRAQARKEQFAEKEAATSSLNPTAV